jgi:hypothetical protein
MLLRRVSTPETIAARTEETAATIATATSVEMAARIGEIIGASLSAPPHRVKYERLLIVR